MSGIEFESLRSQLASAQHELYCAVYSTQNLQLPDDLGAYRASVSAALAKVTAAVQQLKKVRK